MKIKPVADGIYLLPLKNVNAYLLEMEHGLVLIDTGLPGSEHIIITAIESLGHKREMLQSILLTHCHTDHAGSAAALKRMLPHVKIYANAMDADIIEKGLQMRPMSPAPGLLNKLLFRLFGKGTPIEPVQIDVRLADGEHPDFSDDLMAVHLPGHCLGQLGFLHSGHGGIMFVADVATNMTGLGFSMGYEDLEVGKQSIRKLGQYDFEIACFGHGRPIMWEASRRFQNMLR
ncbi:MBL fold metallo-hydrolase [Paenibacillus sp. GCM10012306]|uniref:MBL fold metallo-hydrolase n=1 Tax=Paenibacillus sp. GCM10012306 TaxID=3317342 RepID=UPI00361A56AA